MMMALNQKNLKFFLLFFTEKKQHALWFQIRDYYFNITLRCMKAFDKWKEEFDPREDREVMVDLEQPFHLIVWNDDVNTFEWVIETLMEICKHSREQAEQCAYIIHYKGKYSVKEGTYEKLKPMCDAITERGISATVETVSV